MPISDAEYHEREANGRAYAARQVEAAKVRATREQTEEMRLLRKAVQELLFELRGSSQPGLSTPEE